MFDCRVLIDRPLVSKPFPHHNVSESVPRLGRWQLSLTKPISRVTSGRSIT